MANITKAKAKLKTDFLYVPLGGIELVCQFNPESISIRKTTNWGGQATPNRDHPRTEFGGGNAATYSLTLFFDAWATSTDGTRHDVREDTNKLMAMALKTNGYSTNLAFPYLMEPASVIFIWGDVTLFRAVLTSLNITFTQFDSTGAPTAAKADCTFTEQSHPMDFLPAQNPSSRTKPRNTVRVTQGDRLDNIAADFYGDPRMWRTIAEENEIENPFDLKPGQLLSMPMPE